MKTRTGSGQTQGHLWGKVTFLRQCYYDVSSSGNSKWDIVIMQKRTGLFPKGNWTHQSAAATAYTGVEQEAQDDDDL